MDESKSYLIVGLGNPGSAYKQTRHNVGFHIVQTLALKLQMSFKKSSHLTGELAEGAFHGKKVYLLLPATFMNLSGEAVRRSLDYFEVPLEHLIVVCDDVALPLGTIRMRTQGSSGGHNGLKSVEAHLNTQYYARLRIGVGAPEGQEVLADYVLDRFSLEESKGIEESTVRAVEVLEKWVSSGIAPAMQAANTVKKV